MKLFIDGLIFGRQQWGGISRMWAQYLLRFPQYFDQLKLLLPRRLQSKEIAVFSGQLEKYQVVTDYFHWPVRFFEPIPVRSRLLTAFYVDSQVDIFHSTYFSTLYNKKIRKVATVYDMIPEFFQQQQPNNYWVLKEIEKKRETLRNADKIIAISNSTRNDLLRYYPWLPAEKVEVVYLGYFGFSSLDLTLADVALKYSLTIEPLAYYLLVGEGRGYKNFSLVLSYVEQEVKKQPDPSLLKFVWVGGKNIKESIALINEKRLASYFHCIDYVTDQELSVLYQHAAALVVPSRYEGFGLPVLEAMAAGCPVVCSRVSSLPEVGGEAAIYFDPDSVESFRNALQVQQGTSREQSIAAGKQNLKRFSWDQSTADLVAVYRKLY